MIMPGPYQSEQELVRQRVELDFYATLLGANNHPTFISTTMLVDSDTAGVAVKIVEGAKQVGAEDPQRVGQFICDLYGLDTKFPNSEEYINAATITLSELSGYPIEWNGEHNG
jgi:hypothetical protein